MNVDMNAEPVDLTVPMNEAEWNILMAMVTTGHMILGTVVDHQKFEDLYQRLLFAGAIAGFEIEEGML